MTRKRAAQSRSADELEAEVLETVAGDMEQAKIRGKFQVLQRKYADALDQLGSLQATAELLMGLREDEPEPKRYQPLTLRSRGKATAILPLNDWHREEFVDREVVNGKNAFDLAIGKRRIEETFRRFVLLVQSARHLSNIRDMVVLLLGDMISGYIHPELVENNLLSPTQAILQVKDDLRAGLQFLAEHAEMERISVVCVTGNHGRTTDRKRVSTDYKNSYEWLLYNYLADLFTANPKIDWRISRSYHAWPEIQGLPVRVHHGDAVRYQGGVGGITIPVNKAIAQWDKVRTAALDIFGHWHSLEMRWPKWISCPSLIGYNAYSIAIKAEYQQPMQTFIVVDRDRGLTEVKPIFCGR